ncbi:NADH dehydrogenase [ubiquinone] 1 alpha subcomplex subunit 13 [Holothuria leucospilota]|uniref:NADH dehydrogenase [ubiquinone] 1 alpha subcomplex subunit 13 n=1 Tax=Holothuria leucospilota TaxID=206669 RepID=A0A9Q1GZM9_HOLLE|nr:NADH dehydrogenase [ubiquinone] 1 alpha subcomplex subunit 13 [Holothuria leucospilota]
MAGAFYKQDMPPKGGYGPIDYKRMMPKRGPSGYVLFAGCIGVMAIGHVAFAYTNRQRKNRLYEQREAFFGIMPLLEAEWDRDTLKQLKHTQEQEAIIMKDVPDWVVGESVYHTKRWVRPRVEDLYFLANSKERREAMFGFNTFV